MTESVTSYACHLFITCPVWWWSYRWHWLIPVCHCLLLSSCDGIRHIFALKKEQLRIILHICSFWWLFNYYCFYIMFILLLLLTVCKLNTEIGKCIRLFRIAYAVFIDILFNCFYVFFCKYPLLNKMVS